MHTLNPIGFSGRWAIHYNDPARKKDTILRDLSDRLGLRPRHTFVKVLESHYPQGPTIFNRVLFIDIPDAQDHLLVDKQQVPAFLREYPYYLDSIQAKYWQQGHTLEQTATRYQRRVQITPYIDPSQGTLAITAPQQQMALDLNA